MYARSVQNCEQGTADNDLVEIHFIGRGLN